MHIILVIKFDKRSYRLVLKVVRVCLSYHGLKDRGMEVGW